MSARVRSRPSKNSLYLRASATRRLRSASPLLHVYIYIGESMCVWTTRDDSSWRHQPPAVSGATGPRLPPPLLPRILSFLGLSRALSRRFFCFSLVNALPKPASLLLSASFFLPRYTILYSIGRGYIGIWDDLEETERTRACVYIGDLSFVSRFDESCERRLTTF